MSELIYFFKFFNKIEIIFKLFYNNQTHCFSFDYNASYFSNSSNFYKVKDFKGRILGLHRISLKGPSSFKILLKFFML